MEKCAVVVPSWNGLDELKNSIPSLLSLTGKPKIIVVENGSVDGSADYLAKTHPEVDVVQLLSNRGFAGGVNAGIEHAREQGFTFVALFNNDAVADPDWLTLLHGYIVKHPDVGIATGSFLGHDGKTIDSTGDMYTIWGLPYPRGRGDSVASLPEEPEMIFAATGGASLFRMKMLDQIGLFDEDFFAYYEDVDLGFRAQLAGWKVALVPDARAYHEQGTTSSKIKGFTTYQTLKNLPFLAIKNVPIGLLWMVLPRLCIADMLFTLRALSRGHIGPVLKAYAMRFWLTPKMLAKRHRIQRTRKLTTPEVEMLIDHELPPNARMLRKFLGARSQS